MKATIRTVDNRVAIVLDNTVASFKAVSETEWLVTVRKPSLYKGPSLAETIYWYAQSQRLLLEIEFAGGIVFSGVLKASPAPIDDLSQEYRFVFEGMPFSSRVLLKLEVLIGDGDGEMVAWIQGLNAVGFGQTGLEAIRNLTYVLSTMPEKLSAYLVKKE